ncbi:MAG: HPF/RaiA family ribosome-associated protein [Bacteroidota bacterium]
MQIIIQSPHFTAGKTLTNYVNKKVSKLPHFHLGIIAAEVCLKIDGAHPTGNKVCEIRLVVPGDDLFAMSRCDNFEQATNETVDALKEQIRKMKVDVYY